MGGGQGGQGEKDALKREDCQAEKEWEKQEEADSKPSHPDLLLITCCCSEEHRSC